jgi:hypothetical protein
MSAAVTLERNMVPAEAREAFWIWLQRRLRNPRTSASKTVAAGHPVFTTAAVEAELSRLRDAGKIVCTNGKWWVR